MPIIFGSPEARQLVEEQKQLHKLALDLKHLFETSKTFTLCALYTKQHALAQARCFGDAGAITEAQANYDRYIAYLAIHLGSTPARIAIVLKDFPEGANP
jgi:hypothetical protein